MLQAVEAARGPAPEITVDHLVERTRAMFTGGAPASGPAASGSDLTASEPLDGLLRVGGTVARAREGVRNTSGITRMSPPGACGGGGEARGVPHLGPAFFG